MLKKAHPNGCFWLKVDACDLKVALQESVRAKWDGDVDLGDGKLEEMRADYDARRAEASLQDGDVQRELLEMKVRKLIDSFQDDQ